MRFFRFLLFVFLLLWMLIACRQSTSPPVKSDITLTAEFTGVTEAWIAIHNPEPQAGAVLQLWRGEHLVFSGGGSITDTTVADSGLAPAQSYRYRARLLKDGALLRTGPELTITTMDTTSHDFTWEVIEFPSPFGSGGLYDVAIINENDIWAVGEIYSDSAKPWLPYNAVHWDGEKWELVRITYGGISWPIRTIFAFNSNEIWFDAFVKWNGTNFIELPIPDVLIGAIINKSWGTSGNDFYIVGDNGLIAHYDGSNWRRIESGTEERGKDVWGLVFPDESYTVFFAFSDSYKPGRHVLLKLDNKGSLHLTDWPDSVYIESIWTDSPHYLFACGSGVFHHNNHGWSKYHNLPYVYRERIRGNGLNDIYVVGHFGQFLHFNGKNWHVIQLNSDIGIVEGLAVKGNTIYAVGISISTQSAYIIKGVHQK